MKKTIALGSDHRGFLLKKLLIASPIFLSDEYVVQDCGAFSPERSDYPLFAQEVAKSIVKGSANFGILCCGTGAGMAIAANRFSYIRAAVAWNKEIARRVKEEDDCNVLVIPADYVLPAEVEQLVQEWLESKFKAGRYAQRIQSIDHYA